MKKNQNNSDDIINATLSNGKSNIKLPQRDNNTEGIKCMKCNTINKKESNYCKKCGFDMTSDNLCPKCKNGIKDDQSFCGKCGYKLKDSNYYETDDNRIIEHIVDEEKYSKAKKRAKIFLIIGFTIVFIVALLFSTPLGQLIFVHFDGSLNGPDYVALGKFNAPTIIVGTIGVCLVAIGLSDIYNVPYMDVEMTKKEFEKKNKKSEH